MNDLYSGEIDFANSRRFRLVDSLSNPYKPSVENTSQEIRTLNSRCVLLRVGFLVCGVTIGFGIGAAIVSSVDRLKPFAPMTLTISMVLGGIVLYVCSLCICRRRQTGIKKSNGTEVVSEKLPCEPE